MKRYLLGLFSFILLANSTHQSTTESICNPQTNSTCACDPGLTGPDCSEDINECLSFNCNGHGACMNTRGSYYCDCDLEFTGSDCQTDLNECIQSPGPFCGNGTCINMYGSYRCKCDPGFTGESCETEINECEIYGCDNGICTDLVNDYQCDCYMGWTGKQCEVDFDECDVPGKNHGPCFDTGTISCTEGNNTYTCSCIVGWTGQNCSDDIKECGTVCINYVECEDFLFGLYNCTCKEGYTGQDCETDLTPCSPEPCTNGGICYDETSFQITFPNGTADRRSELTTGQYYCDCPSGYNGTQCENDLPFCQPDTCKNNGTCIEGIGNATSCECVEGFSGQHCDEDLDFCTETVCRNGGTCVEGIGVVVTCFCPNGTVGPYCDLPDKPTDNIVLIIIIILVVLVLFFLVCLITTLCASSYWERTRGKGSKRYEVNMWTLEYQQRAPVTVAAIEDTAPASEFDYRDVELRYMDTLTSHSSFESQTAILQFAANRNNSVNSSFRSGLVRTPSARSFRRTLSGRHNTRRSGRSRGDRVQTNDHDEPLSAVEKGRLVDMLETGISTFKPPSR